MHTHDWILALVAALALAVLGADLLRAAEPARLEAFESPVPFEPFEKGERVAFLGDSITASGDYVHMIRQFYATRFPDRPMRIYNCGIGGARAESSWPRIDADCLDLDPTTVVIMLGMNDAGTAHYIRETGEKRDAATRGLVAKYEDYMTRIMNRIGEDPNRELALIVSSPYDQTAELERDNAVGKNDTIRTLGAWLVEQGRERNAAVIDFNTPLLRINAGRQMRDPSFSAIGRDRVHPGAPGHLVMTWAFLRAQGIEGPVARVEVDAQTGSAQTVNASVADVDTGDAGLTFAYASKALPYPDAANPFDSPAAEWAPFTDELNREWLVVGGLKDGRWSLTMDGETVGEFATAELAAGIDLARRPASPTHRHAQEVFALAKQVEEAERNLRAVARVRWIILEPRGIDIDDTERADAAVREYLAERPNHGYWQSRAAIFFRLRSPEKREAERVRMEGLMDRLYEINDPKPHRVELRPASGQ